jgi:Na+-driven multidrug efflux pump
MYRSRFEVLPKILGYPIQLAYFIGFNVIDQVIVGLLGADAVAAVGLSNSIASMVDEDKTD